MPGFMACNAAFTSTVSVTGTRASNEKLSHDFPLPARRKPSSIKVLNRGISLGTKRSGSTPSQISPHSRSMESEPLPSTIYFGYLDRPPSFEYLHDPEKTAAGRRGNLITAGDYGYLDEDGYLYLLDRRTDVGPAGPRRGPASCRRDRGRPAGRRVACPLRSAPRLVQTPAPDRVRLRLPSDRGWQSPAPRTPRRLRGC
jgi:hypothetical protein